jgi:chromosome segregation ATPase
VGAWFWGNLNAVLSAFAVLGGNIALLWAAYVRRSISREENLFQGYDNFVRSLEGRIKSMEHERAENQNRMSEIETRLRVCEADRTNMHITIDELQRRVGLIPP